MSYDIQSPKMERLGAFSFRHMVRLDFAAADYTVYYHVNGYSHPRLPVITGNQIRLLEWGLIPPEVKDATEAFNARNSTLNAEAETIFIHPVFRCRILGDRGILLAEGFYEWWEYQGRKYPYFIKGTELLTIGCVLSRWQNPATGRLHTTFSIVTTPVAEEEEDGTGTARRMPLIVTNFKKWLDPGLQRRDLESLMVPYTGPLKSWTVSRKLIEMGKDGSNTPDIADPISYRELIPHRADAR